MQKNKVVDLETWLTKEQVAQRLGVKPRTVVDMRQKNQLSPQRVNRPGLSPVNLYDPDEVDQLMQARVDGKMEIVPANGPGPLVASAPATRSVAPLPDQLRALLASATPAALPLDRKRYLTPDEAIAYTGLGEFYIAQHCESWGIGPHGKRVYRRADLDKL